MAELDAIGKDRSNTQGAGFKYRGIDDVYNALHVLLAKHGVFTVPQVQDMKREERQSKAGSLLNYTILTIDFKFYAQDGSSVTATMIGEAMDSGDKSSNKAMSVAHKYAFLQVFAIPTVDEKDPDGQTHELQSKGSTFRGDEYNGAPWDPAAEFGAGPSYDSPAPATPKRGPSDAQIKRLFAIATSAGWPQKDLKDYVKATTGAESSKDIPLAKYDELCKYIEAHPMKGR
jgi:hypothetical protein